MLEIMTTEAIKIIINVKFYLLHKKNVYLIFLLFTTTKIRLLGEYIFLLLGWYKYKTTSFEYKNVLSLYTIKYFFYATL